MIPKHSIAAMGRVHKARTMSDSRPARDLAALCMQLLVLSTYRAWVAAGTGIPLFVDEAQYWTWSLAPDWGYFSKPPMVAWIIRAFSVFGQGELAIRAGSLLLHPLTAVLLYLFGRTMFDSRVGLYAAVLFMSLPLVGFNSLFMTTDAPLFFLWGLACYALWRALQRDRLADWMLMGAALGLGMLSKYSMVFFLPSLALVLRMPDYRRHWKNPFLFLAVLLAFLIFLPNLWWNARMEFVSFRHTADISRLDQDLFHPRRLIEFLAGQFACMGPLAFAFLLLALGNSSVWRDGRYRVLAALSLPFLALISVQALLARANLNWAAPVYFAGSLLVAARWAAQEKMKWFWSAVMVNLLCLSVFYHYHALADAAGISLQRKSDPYARVAGWPQMGEALRAAVDRYPDDKVAVVRRDEFAMLAYYAGLFPERLRIWNQRGEARNHFQLFYDMKHETGADVIIATQGAADSSMARSFRDWTPLGTLTVPLYPDYGLTLHLYRGMHFKGYAR